jgi:hypothetical protein
MARPGPRVTVPWLSRRTPRPRRPPHHRQGVGGGHPGHGQVSEGLALVEGDPAPLAQFEQGQEAHDDLHPGHSVGGQGPEARRCRPRGPAVAFQLVHGLGDGDRVDGDVGRSTTGAGTFGVWPAGRRRPASGVIPASRSGARSRNSSSRPAWRGTDNGPPVRPAVRRRRRRPRRPGARAGGPAAGRAPRIRELLVVVDLVAAGQELRRDLSSMSTAAMTRNSDRVTCRSTVSRAATSARNASTTSASGMS